MNVECLAQMTDRHRGALNMPAWPPRPPGAVPGGLSRLRPFPGHSLLLRALDNLVIDVRKVFNKRHLEIQMLQIATDDIKDDCTARMSQMTLIVDRDAADVHPHPAGLERRKTLLAAGHGIENFKRAHWKPICWSE